MSRQNVEKILGKPDYRRFDGGGEEWEYHRISSVLYGNSIKIIVYFADGRVTGMDTFNGDEILLPPASGCDVSFRCCNQYGSGSSATL